MASLDCFVVVAETCEWAPVGHVAHASLVPPGVPLLETGVSVDILSAPDLFALFGYTYNPDKQSVEEFYTPEINNQSYADIHNEQWRSQRVAQSPYQTTYRHQNITLHREEPFDLERLLAEEAGETEADAPAPDLAEVLAELDAMVGLQSVKDHIKKLVAFEQLRTVRRERDMPTQPISHHMVLTGPAGTGKTTVARLIAKIYHALGIMPSSRFIETDRGGLVGRWIGETAQKTSDVIERSIGGTLFIDEAYALAGGSSKDFGHEAVSTLLKAMEDRRGDFVVIVAGYEEEMKQLWEMNSGFESRFPRRNRIGFESYDADELVAIANQYACASTYRLSTDAQSTLAERAEEARHGDRFANGRWARDMVEDAMLNQALRIDLDAVDLTELIGEDIPKAETTVHRQFGFACSTE